MPAEVFQLESFESLPSEQILREKCLNMEFFQVRIFCIRTEYGDLHSKYLYSMQIRDSTDQEKIHIRTFFTQWES